MAPKDHQTARIRVATQIQETLTDRIASGEFKPGSYLPTAKELASDFHTSRSTIAIALDLLHQAGLVTKPGRRGTQVRCPVERLERPLVGIIHSPYDPSARNVTDAEAVILGAREILETLGYPFEDLTVYRAQASADELAERFGAMVFVETFRAQDVILDLERRRIPLAVANLEIDLEVSGTRVDHRATTCRAVQTLAALGHRRIAFLGREPGRHFYGESRVGYLDGLALCGIQPDESLIAVAEKTDALAAYMATRNLLSLQSPITAVVAGRDALAEGACRAVEEAGLEVGRHVSVVGYDDYSWQESRDFLSTFHEPCREMGRQAAKMLADRVIYGWRPPEKRLVEAPFVLRKSAGPAPEPTDGHARS